MNTSNNTQNMSKIASLVNDNKALSLAHSYGLTIQRVSWEDTARFKNSCWGPNISDMTLNVHDRDMPVIRRPNLVDLTCDIPSSNFSVMVGNEKGESLTKISLEEYIKNIGTYSGRGNLPTVSLWKSRDSELLLSSQACILPLNDGKVNFKVKLYNYQSTNKSPAVLVIVATHRGTSCQILESGRESLYFNDNGEAYDFVAKRLEDDRKERNVATKGEMTEEEKVRNLVYIYQIPLKVETRRSYPMANSFSSISYDSLEEEDGIYDSETGTTFCYFNGVSTQNMVRDSSRGMPKSRGFDHAMLDKGDHKGKYKGLGNTALIRDENYPIRLTVQYYYVTDTVDITETLMKKIAEQLEKSYTHGKDKGSLVTSKTSRPTEPKNLPTITYGPIVSLSNCV